VTENTAKVIDIDESTYVSHPYRQRRNQISDNCNCSHSTRARCTLHAAVKAAVVMCLSKPGTSTAFSARGSRARPATASYCSQAGAATNHSLAAVTAKQWHSTGTPLCLHFTPRPQQTSLETL